MYVYIYRTVSCVGLSDTGLCQAMGPKAFCYKASACQVGLQGTKASGATTAIALGSTHHSNHHHCGNKISQEHCS